MFSRIDDFFGKAEDAFSKLSGEIKHAKPEELFCNSKVLKKQLLDFSIIEFGNDAYFKHQPIHIKESGKTLLKQIQNNEIAYNTTPQPAFNKQFNLLIEDLNANHNKGYTNYIACVSEQQAKRFHDIFDDSNLDVAPYNTIILSLYHCLLYTSPSPRDRG